MNELAKLGEIDPDERVVTFVKHVCRECGAESDMARDLGEPNNRQNNEEVYGWLFAHVGETGHSTHYTFRIERQTGRSL